MVAVIILPRFLPHYLSPSLPDTLHLASSSMRGFRCSDLYPLPPFCCPLLGNLEDASSHPPTHPEPGPERAAAVRLWTPLLGSTRQLPAGVGVGSRDLGQLRVEAQRSFVVP